MPAVTFLYFLGSMVNGLSRGIMTVTQRREQGQKKKEVEKDI